MAVLLCVGLSAGSVRAAGLQYYIHLQDLTNGGAVYDSGSPAGTGTAINSGDSFSTGNQTVGKFTGRVTVSPDEDSTLSDLNTTSIDVNNTGASPSQLEILVTVTGYQLPSYPLLVLSSSVSGSASAGVLNQPATLQSYADANNGVYTLVGAGVASPGPQFGVLLGNGNAQYTFAPNGTLSTLFAENGTYSVTQRFLVTLNQHANGQFTISTSLTAAPLPSTAGVGMLLLGGLGGVGGIRRLHGRRAIA